MKVRLFIDIIVLIHKGGKWFLEVKEFAYFKPGSQLMPASPQFSFLLTVPLLHVVLCSMLYIFYFILHFVQNGFFSSFYQSKTLNFLHDLCACSSPISFGKYLILAAFIDFLHLWITAVSTLSTTLLLTFILVLYSVILTMSVFLP